MGSSVKGVSRKYVKFTRVGAVQEMFTRLFTRVGGISDMFT